ncbi:MAG: putative Ig domain-containing protein [Thermoanaerobaculia bacterium]
MARPAAADHGITVGSFALQDPASRFRTAWTDVRGVVRIDPTARPENISNFSSPGPTRDGRIKPEIAAPGEQVIGAVSQDAYPGRSPSSIFNQHIFPEADALIIKNDPPDRTFGVIQGTSFSAPVVTGLAARLLAANPALDAVQVKNILLNAALSDSFTGNVPNESWGYGKTQLSLAANPGDSIPGHFRIETATLPAGVVGRQYNEAFSASGGIPPYTWKIFSGSPPNGINLASGDLLTGIPTSAGTYRFTVSVEDSSIPRQTTTRPFQISITDRAPLEIMTVSLPAGDIKSSYKNSLQARGGTPPYIWSLIQGELPAGVHLSSHGNLAGAPLFQGRFFLTVSVEDAANSTALRSLRLDVGDSSQVAWQPVGLDDQYVRLISIDPNDSDHLVAGAAAYARRNLVFQSFDAGRTWSEISLHKGLPFDTAAVLGIDPTTSEIWAQAYPLPYRYDPAGQEWRPVMSCSSRTGGVNYSRTIDIGFDAAGNSFLLPYYMDCPLMPAVDAFQGFLLSRDHRNSWQNIGQFPATGALDLTGDEQLGHLSVFSSDSRHLYASRNKDWHCCERLEEKFFRSNDGGSSWTELPINTPSVSLPFISQSDPFDIIRAPWNPDEYSSIPWNWDYAGTSTIERSVNGGVSWEANEVPGHRRVCKLERSFSSPSILLAGTTDGLFKSQDHGTTWQSLSPGGATANFCEGGALAIDPGDPQKIYVGLKNARIAISNDGGVSWRMGNEGLFRRLTSGLALSPSRPTDLLLISGVPFVSRTGGNRWTLSSQGVVTGYSTEANQFPIISQANPELFFFVGAHSWDLYRSGDRGISWERLEPVFGKPTTFSPRYSYQPGIVSLIADPFNSNVLVARVHFFEKKNGKLTEAESMWRSTNRGATWRKIKEPEPSILYSDHVAPSIAFAQDRPGHLYALGPKKLYESFDRGTSWKAIAGLKSAGSNFPNYRLVVKPAPSDPLYLYVIANEFVGVYNVRSSTWNWSTLPNYSFLSSLAVDPHDPMTAYFGRTYTIFGDPSQNANNQTGGIEKTTDGGKSWVRLASFPKSLSVISLETDPTTSEIVYAATLEDGGYRSKDGGATWEKLDNFGVLADSVNTAVKDPSNSSILFVGTQGFGVQVSTNGGQSFIPRVKGLTNLNVTSLAFDPGSPQILYAGTENGLFKSSDSGSNWTPTAFADGFVTDISVETGAKPRRVHITTFGYGLGTSQDEGRTFTFHTAGMGSLNLTSTEIESHGSSRRLWLTMRGGDGIMVSDDLGVTWKPVGGSGLTTRNVNDLAIESGAGRVWIATDEGVLWTEDGGATWSDLSAGLPRGVPATSLSFHPGTGEVLVGLFDEHNGGIYRGGNVSGSWVSFNEGLPELRVRKLTNDGGHVVEDGGRATTFWAGTAGAGLFSIEIKSANVGPQITTTGLSSAGVGVLYNQTVQAIGGVAPYVWSLARGSLPPGLGLEATTGRITGTPVQSGTFRLTVRVADGLSHSALREFEIRVSPVPPGVTSGSQNRLE